MQATTDHIRPFFWLPDEYEQSSNHHARNGRIEELVFQCWTQLAKKKNGGYEPVPLERGWHRDEVLNEPHWSDGKEVKIMVIGPVKVPAGHAMYKEGCGAYVLRYSNHSFLRFRRLYSGGAQQLTLPDRVAAELALKGKLKVVEWDTDEGRRAFEAKLNLEPISVEEQQRRKHVIETRGPRRKVEVPYT